MCLCFHLISELPIPLFECFAFLKCEVCFVLFLLAVQEDSYFWACCQLVKEPSVPVWRVSPWMTNCVKRHYEIAGKKCPAHSDRTEAFLMASLQNVSVATMWALLTLFLLKLCNEAASRRSGLQSVLPSGSAIVSVGVLIEIRQFVKGHVEKHPEEEDAAFFGGDVVSNCMFLS